MADIRVLVIAPYENMKPAIERAAESFPNMTTDVFTGDLMEGAAIFRSLKGERYDAVISRGGTAAMIRNQTELPVVEIRISIYDVLRAIRLVENYSEQYAVVGFQSVTETAHTVCAIMKKDTEIITISSAEEVGPVLESLKQQGCPAVLCDNVTHNQARALGLKAFLITSGEESLHEALANAEMLGTIYRRLRIENDLLKMLLERENGCSVVLDRGGRVRFSMPDAPDEDLLNLLRSHVPELSRSMKTTRFYHNRQGMLYAIEGRQTTLEDEEVFLFAYQPTTIPLRQSRLGIRSLGRTECEHLFLNSFFSVTGAMGELDGRVNALARSRQSVMIIGETGTGKQQMAHALYLRGPLTRNPFIVVDCTLMDDKSWSYLLGHHSSPLNSSDVTIYFQHMEVLPEERQNELLSIMKDTALTRRERILFSCDCRDNEKPPEVVRRFVSNMGCSTLKLPTLRSRCDEIGSLATLYLSSVNNELGTHIVGFEPGSIRLMEQYDWPSNYTQFKQMIHELAALTSSAYIRTDAVAEAIALQRSLTRQPSRITGNEGPVRTLEEITRAAITQAIRDNRGNQSAAARQLGISRTTLWRYIGAPVTHKPTEKEG